MIHSDLKCQCLNSPLCPSTFPVHPISIKPVSFTVRLPPAGEMEGAIGVLALGLPLYWLVFEQFTRNYRFFSQRKDCTKSVQSIPVAAVLVLAATAPVQGGMCSPGAARAELECNSGAAPTPKQAIKRIHLVPNYLIHFCSVLKTLCKKAFCLKARQGLALSSGFQ